MGVQRAMTAHILPHTLFLVLIAEKQKVRYSENSCSRSQLLKAVTHALALLGGERPSAVVTAFCVFVVRREWTFVAFR